MRLFIFSLTISWALALALPPSATAEPFSSIFTKHGVYDPRIAPYMPPYKKKRPPLHWPPGAYIFPYNCSDDCDSHKKKRTRPPEKTSYQEPLVLNPDIFNPEPKTPLTLVIEDGVVVERYRGYEKQDESE